jgi:hypothetical protein
MALYDCGCGWGSTAGGYMENLLAHVRGTHMVDVRLGNAHYAHCNECEKSNGHDRRLWSEEALISHLEQQHGLYIASFEGNGCR